MHVWFNVGYVASLDHRVAATSCGFDFRSGHW